MSYNTFIHLRTQSSYSLAESTIKIKKLVELAHQNNMPAIALTDNNNMFGNNFPKKYQTSPKKLN